MGLAGGKIILQKLENAWHDAERQGAPRLKTFLGDETASARDVVSR